VRGQPFAVGTDELELQCGRARVEDQDVHRTFGRVGGGGFPTGREAGLLRRDTASRLRRRAALPTWVGRSVRCSVPPPIRRVECYLLVIAPSARFHSRWRSPLPPAPTHRVHLHPRRVALQPLSALTEVRHRLLRRIASPVVVEAPRFNPPTNSRLVRPVRSDARAPAPATVPAAGVARAGCARGRVTAPSTAARRPDR
jgi:hypothetical protein